MNYLNDVCKLALVDGNRDVPCRTFGRFAVHKSPDAQPLYRATRWHVTYTPTGTAVIGAPSLSVAVQAAQRMAEYEQTSGSIVSLGALGVRLLCGALPAWVFRGRARYGCHNVPDITRWVRGSA